MRNNTISDNGRLLNRLGNWIGKPSWTEEWRWMPGSKELARQIGTEWRIFRRVLSSHGTRSNKFEYFNTLPSISTKSLKASTQSLEIDLY